MLRHIPGEGHGAPHLLKHLLTGTPIGISQQPALLGIFVEALLYSLDSLNPWPVVINSVLNSSLFCLSFPTLCPVTSLYTEAPWGHNQQAIFQHAKYANPFENSNDFGEK